MSSVRQKADPDDSEERLLTTRALLLLVLAGLVAGLVVVQPVLGGALVVFCSVLAILDRIVRRE